MGVYILIAYKFLFWGLFPLMQAAFDAILSSRNY